MRDIRFRDREQAGQFLARQLAAYARRDDVMVLGLSRGGVPVAAVVAAQLAVELGVLVVRKIGVPGHRELAMGALASGGVCVLDDDIIATLHIPRALVDQALRRALDELVQRERVYGVAGRVLAPPGRVLILVDDGLATGATMRAAIAAARQTQAARIVVAVPVGAPDTCAALRAEADEFICLAEPQGFYAVSQWYQQFDQLGDEEVKKLLANARTSQGGGAAPPARAGAPGQVGAALSGHDAARD